MPDLWHWLRLGEAEHKVQIIPKGQSAVWVDKSSSISISTHPENNYTPLICYKQVQ